MKKLNIIFLILFFILSLPAFSSQDAQLVLDMRNVSGLPKHFRSTIDPIAANLNTMGFADLNIAGGSQFSKLSLQSLLQKIPSKHITIIDLRQESHGFLNGNAISWYGWKNAGNAGLSTQQIESRQNRLLGELEMQPLVKVVVVLTTTPNQQIAKTKTIEFSVHNVSSEEDLVKQSKFGYERVYVEDHAVPSPKQVDRFIQIIKRMPRLQWIYFHDRAGLGRVTTFMVMFDILRNAKRVSFEDIIARQAALGGKDLSEMPEVGTAKYQAALNRLNFLKQFYQYARENSDRFQTSFTTWSRKHSSSSV